MAIAEQVKLKAVAAKRSSRRAHASASQADFFEVLDTPVNTVEQAIKSNPPKPPAPNKPIVAEQTSPPMSGKALHCVAEADVPDYDPDEVAFVDASLAELPSGKQWFTYMDIRRSFGISRATVARKVKAGLVPGIRFDGDRVVEEGAVRRFSRDQVRFVLLAVRRRDWKSAAF